MIFCFFLLNSSFDLRLYVLGILLSLFLTDSLQLELFFDPKGVPHLTNLVFNFQD